MGTFGGKVCELPSRKTQGNESRQRCSRNRHREESLKSETGTANISHYAYTVRNGDERQIRAKISTRSSLGLVGRGIVGQGIRRQSADINRITLSLGGHKVGLGLQLIPEWVA